MSLTLSAALLLGIAVAALLKFRALGFGAGVVAVLFGFYLANTDAAASINQFVSAIANAAGDIGN